MAEHTTSGKIGGAAYLGIALVVLLVTGYFAWQVWGPDPKPKQYVQDSHVVAAQTIDSVSVSTPTVTSRTIKTSVICGPWRREPQTCITDEQPTARFGIAERGARFCLATPQGKGHDYRLQYVSASGTDEDYPETGLPREVVVNATRLIGNRGKEGVPVTYWLGGPEGCGEDATPLDPPK